MAKRRDQIEEAARVRAEGGRIVMFRHVRGLSIRCANMRILPASEGQPQRQMSLVEVGVGFVRHYEPICVERAVEVCEGSSVKDEIALLGKVISELLVEAAERFEVILRKPVPPPPAPERESLHKVSGIEAIQRQAMLDRA
jgi:hypothetical protein